MGKFFENAKVLLCDDDRISLELATGMLRAYGIEPVTAVNGAAAVELLEVGFFDLAIMNMEMPVMTGYEVAASIRSSISGKTVPLVAMMANPAQNEIDEIYAVGMNGYITKPVTAESLYKELSKWLQHRRKAQSAQTVPDKPGKSAKELDWNDGLKRFASKVDRYERALARFAEDLKTSVPAICEASDNGNFAEARETAHRIKGVAGNLGAVKLFTRAAALEKEFAEGYAGSGTLTEFLESSAVIIEEIANIIEKKDRAQTPAANESGNAENINNAVKLIKEMKLYCEQFDPLGAEIIAGVLKTHKWEGPIAYKMNEIYALVEGYQYETAVVKINLLLRELGLDG